MYYDEKKKYNQNFSQFKGFVEYNSNVLHIMWWNNPTNSVPFLFFNGKNYSIHKTHKLNGIHTIMIHED
jgi:hypothetical protein